MTASPPLFSQLARGGAAVAAAQGARLLLRLGSMVTLARLLTPDEFGVFGMAALVYGLLQTVRDLGLGTVSLQRGQQSPAESTQFFWLQTAAGLAVALATCIIAVPAAAGFGRPELRPLLAVLAVAFLVGGLGVQFRVILGRALRFRTISVVELTGLAAGLAAAVALAAQGWGFWSLALMIVVQETVTSAGLFLCCDWRPRGWPSIRGTGDHLRRGLHLSGHGITHYLVHMADQAYVASRLGPQALGFYGRAWQLGTLPTHGVLAGMHGWLGQGLVHLRDDAESFRGWCRQVLNTLLYGCAPLAALFACAPETVLRMLLGAGWEPAAGALAVLALTVPVQAWLFVELGILIACRQERRLFWWSLLRLAALAGTLLVVAPRDLAGVATCIAAVKWLLLPAGIALATSSSPLRWSDVGRAALAPGLFGLLLALGLSLTQSWWSAMGHPIAGVAGVTLAVTAGFFLAWPRARRELAAAVRLLATRAG